MTDVHRCPGCPRLFIPHAGAMRCDAVGVGIDDPTWLMLEGVATRRTEATKRLKDRGGVLDEQHSRYLRTLLGAAGEWAVAYALKLDFDEKPFGLDVGGYNVRTRGRHEFDLIIQDYDVQNHPTVPMILVTASETWRAMILRGWLTAREAQPQWRQTYGGHKAAFFVPQFDLHDLRRLPERRAALGIDRPQVSDDVPDEALV